MKRETGTMMRLGVFITLGIAVFIFGIYFIGERQQIFRKTIHVSGVFRDVVGLQEGNNVRLSGDQCRDSGQHQDCERFLCQSDDPHR